MFLHGDLTPAPASTGPADRPAAMKAAIMSEGVEQLERALGNPF
jgi:hypothetical protein